MYAEVRTRLVENILDSCEKLKISLNSAHLAVYIMDFSFINCPNFKSKP